MKRGKLLAGLATAALLLGGCGSNPLQDPAPGPSGASKPLAIGSLDYYSSEIVAEIFAQTLQAGGYQVKREFRIGAREVSFPELKSGSLDIFPEYTGPLLKFLDDSTRARGTDEVFQELKSRLPAGLSALEQSAATDQDSYVVTREFADKWNLKTIEDLAKVKGPIKMGASSEAETRPNGPRGLREVYGLEVGFTPIEDSGGPLTVKALKSDQIQLAIIYTGDPSIEVNNLVVLEDTKKLFLASHIVPVVTDRVDARARALLNAVIAKLSPTELLSLNRKSVQDQAPAATIAAAWLQEKGLVK